MRLLGMDFSGDAGKWGPNRKRTNVWVAEGRSESGILKVESLFPIQRLPGLGHPYDRVSDFLNKGAGIAAIDAPFSLPRHRLQNGNVEDTWRLAANLPRSNRCFGKGRDLVLAVAPEYQPQGKKEFRSTEAHWLKRGVNTRSTIWAGPRGGAPFAVACMTLLARHEGPVFSLRNSGEGIMLVEAFPAAQLHYWNLPYQSYDGVSRQAEGNREAIISALEKRRGLQISNAHRESCIEVADAVDAVICLFAAAAVSNKMVLEYDQEILPSEGMIVVHA